MFPTSLNSGLAPLPGPQVTTANSCTTDVQRKFVSFLAEDSFGNIPQPVQHSNRANVSRIQTGTTSSIKSNSNDFQMPFALDSMTRVQETGRPLSQEICDVQCGENTGHRSIHIDACSVKSGHGKVTERMLCDGSSLATNDKSSVTTLHLQF
jgi:hypothetical protein